MFVLPANKGFSTAWGIETGGSKASISAMSISTFSLGFASGSSSAGTRKRSFGATGLAAQFACPNHGSSTSRMTSRMGPIGPAVVRTRSMSSEYRKGFGKMILLRAVPPQNLGSVRRKSWLNISTSAREMIRSCSICFGSAHGVVRLQAVISVSGIIVRRPRSARGR